MLGIDHQHGRALRHIVANAETGETDAAACGRAGTILVLVASWLWNHLASGKRYAVTRDYTSS